MNAEGLSKIIWESFYSSIDSLSTIYDLDESNKNPPTAASYSIIQSRSFCAWI